ncbi:unnamed protein product [Lasius platythorax]|uniref:Uncharacterized protein n=1 Tax=Lasius platythorax TaxID=488582 RepID=A0AAV2NVA0_9HYME
MFSNVLAQPHNQKARTVLRTFETTRMQRQIVTSVPLEDSSLLLEPQITLREGDRNKFLVSRAHAVDITFCASDVFRTARQAYNWKERDRGGPGETAARERDWHPAKRRCVIGVADGKCNTHGA